jgi:hypothetical protein
MQGQSVANHVRINRTYAVGYRKPVPQVRDIDKILKGEK